VLIRIKRNYFLSAFIKPLPDMPGMFTAEMIQTKSGRFFLFKIFGASSGDNANSVLKSPFLSLQAVIV
jgi:hypothetical protein